MSNDRESDDRQSVTPAATENAEPATANAPATGPLSSAVMRRRIQRRALARTAAPAGSGGDPSAQRAAIDNAAGSTGQSVAAPVRERVEQTTGADLSSVRVHTGGASQDAAAAIEARAYTVGHDIHFGAGQYQPGTPQGDHLVAHELAHAAQQGPSGTVAQGKLEVSQPEDAAEVAADAVADRATAPAHAGGGSDWKTAFQPTGPAQQMMRMPTGRPGVIHRAPVGGNAFGKFDVTQTTTDGGKAGGTYNSRLQVRFDPEKSKVNATNISFVQTARLTDSKGGLVDPTKVITDRSTKDQTAVDAVTKSGMVGYDNNNKPYSVTPVGEKVPVGVVDPGSSPAPLKSASTFDQPSWNKGETAWSFETVAVAKEGKDAGKIYGGVTWGFDVDKNNKLTAHKAGFENNATATFNEAVDLWNKQATGPEADRLVKDQQKLGPFH